MFQNIGKKIKTLAVVVCWIGIAGSVIGGIVMCAVGADSSGGDLLIGLGIPLIFLGPLFSWIGSFVLYGYGDMITRIRRIERKLYGQENEEEEKSDSAGKDDRLANLQSLREQNLISEEEYWNAAEKLQ